MAKDYKQNKENNKENKNKDKKFKLFTKRNMIIGVLAFNIILIPFCIIFTVD